MSKLAAVVLAAGKGTRMKSETPKVLFPVRGKPMLQHIIDTLCQAGVDDIFVVIGHGSELVQSTIQGEITWVEQREQLGTGHAVVQASSHLEGYAGDVLVLTGDTPLLTTATLLDLVAAHRNEANAATILTTHFPDPTGYGRIVRSETGEVLSIVEDKDANSEQKQIAEINSGTYCFQWPVVGPLFNKLSSKNAQGEYYLTDIIELLGQQSSRKGAFSIQDHREVAGVNDRVQLAWVDSIMRARINEAHMKAGVSIINSEATYIDLDVQIGQDSVILPNTSLHAGTIIGGGCTIGPDVTVRSSSIGAGVTIRNAVIEESTIGNNTSVGPFAYLRPGTVIGDNVKIGDFVEIKKSQIGDGSKIPHLSYVGDAIVGSNTNIGCGVITANYDGKNKHVTEIGDGVFVGSNSNLVAPVKIEKGAYIAAGSTITKNVPSDSLAIARSKQTVKTEWRKKS